MSMKQRMQEKLQSALSPALLEIIDDSSKHAGHTGARPGGETHFTVKVVADAFNGKSRVERHRLVYDALAQELQDRVHALAIIAKSPGEA